MFLHNYFPTSVWEQKEQEFLYLKQGNLSVMQYNREFHKLARFAPSLVAAEKDRMKRFLNGLRPIMQKDLSTSKFLTHAELLDAALKLERGYNQLHAFHNQRNQKRPHQDFNRQIHKIDNQGNDNKRWTPNDDNHSQRLESRCPRCGRQHEAEDCPMTTGACYHCKERGHLAAKCPKRTQPRPNNQ